MMRRVVVELRALMGAMTRPWLVLSVWLLLMTGALALAWHTGSRVPGLATLVCAVGAGVVSFSLALGGLALLTDAQSLRLPGRWPLFAIAGRALGSMLLLTVIAPALALGLAQQSLTPALAIAGAALAGLLIPSTPYLTLATIWALLFAPRALTLTQRHWLGSLITGTQALWLACATLLALVLWRWWGPMRGDARALERAARRTPMLSAMQRGESSLASRPDGWWWFPAASPAGSSPARIIGTCLGAPYAPGLASRARLVLEAVSSVALIAVALGAAGALRQQQWGWYVLLRAGAFLCLVMTWTAFGERIARVFGRASGELEELALLPGLGDRRAQLKALYRAALGVPLLFSIALSVLIVCTALAQPGSGIDTVVFTASTTLLGAAFVVTMLSRPRRLYPHALSVACILLFAAWMMAGWDHPAFQVLWLAPALAACLILVAGVKRLAVLPHPFVLR